MTKIEPITLENLNSLGVDEFNRIYWKGEKLISETMIDFPTWVDWAVGIAAVLTAIHMALGLVDRAMASGKLSKAGRTSGGETSED